MRWHSHEENRQLKAQLAKKTAYHGPVAPHGYFYLADDDDGDDPICPSCYQATPQRIGYIGAARSWNGGIRRECKLCGKHVYKEEMDLSKPARIVPRRSPYT